MILKQEAWLDRSVDPAGGSYYLEVLTDSLAREAWKLFQQIEAAGGFLKYSDSGTLDREIAKSRADREAAVGIAPRSYRGDEPVSQSRRARAAGDRARRIPRPRPARIFEEIRLRTERHAARTGHTPRFLLLEAGDLKMRKARVRLHCQFLRLRGLRYPDLGNTHRPAIPT